MNNDPELLKIKTMHDRLRERQYETEKHDHENILKSLKNDNKHYRKKYKSLNKKKVIIIINEKLLGEGSAITISTKSIINPSFGSGQQLY